MLPPSSVCVPCGWPARYGRPESEAEEGARVRRDRAGADPRRATRVRADGEDARRPLGAPEDRLRQGPPDPRRLRHRSQDASKPLTLGRSATGYSLNASFVAQLKFHRTCGDAKSPKVTLIGVPRGIVPLPEKVPRHVCPRRRTAGGLGANEMAPNQVVAWLSVSGKALARSGFGASRPKRYGRYGEGTVTTAIWWAERFVTDPRTDHEPPPIVTDFTVNVIAG